MPLIVAGWQFAVGAAGASAAFRAGRPLLESWRKYCRHSGETDSGFAVKLSYSASTNGRFRLPGSGSLLLMILVVAYHQSPRLAADWCRRLKFAHCRDAGLAKTDK